MPAAIKLKKSSITGKVPLTTDLDYGELALNYADGKLFYKTSTGTIGSIGTGGNAVNTTRQVFTATAGQTTFSAAYIVGQLDVYLNGIKLVIGTDVTATNGTTIVLTDAAAAGDIVETVAYGATSIDTGNLVAGSLALSTDATIGGNVTINSQSDLRFGDADSSNWVGFQAPATVANNTIWTLPAADGTASQVLTTNGSGTLSWTTVSGSVTSAQIITALGFTPYDSTNPSGYITSSALSSYLPLTGGTVTGNITVQGDVSATNFNSTSDARFKKDITKITNALTKLEQISGYTFTMLETNQQSTGLLAQEVEQVLPQAIGGDESKKTIAYGNLMGLIVEAIKELRAEVQELKSLVE